MAKATSGLAPLIRSDELGRRQHVPPDRLFQLGFPDAAAELRLPRWAAGDRPDREARGSVSDDQGPVATGLLCD